MKYRQFVDWCNQRACDGRWSYDTAVFCIKIVDCINSLPFWKRKRAWREIRDAVTRDVVSVIDEKIKMIGKEETP